MYIEKLVYVVKLGTRLLPFEGCMPNLRNLSGCSTGYWTSSCSSFFTLARPPISSQETLGVSTTVSRRALGLLCPIAYCRKGVRGGGGV